MQKKGKWANQKAMMVVLFCLQVSLLLWTATSFALERLIEDGIREYKAENYEEALVILNQARQEYPSSSIAAFYLGLTLKQMGNYNDAVKDLKDALTLKPSVKDAYVELIDALYILNRLQEAKKWIAEAEEKGVSPARISFLKGLVLLKEGKNSDAIEAFKKAKKLDRSLEQVADFQIATALIKERKIKKAEDVLKAVVSISPTSEIASFAREYENVLRGIIEKHKTWRFRLGIGYQYDDNVVLKPVANIPGINISRVNDTSILNTFMVDYIPLMDAPWLFHAQLGISANTHRKINTHDTIVPSISLMPGYNSKRWAFTLPLSYTHVLLHNRQYMAVASLMPGLSIVISPNHIVQVSGGYTIRQLLQSPINEDEDRDSKVYSLSGGYTYLFSRTRGMFSTRYEYSDDRAEGRNWQNRGHRLGSALLLPVIGRLSLSLSGDVFLQQYKHTHRAFKKKRRDYIYSGNAAILWDIFKFMRLNLQYSYTRADSNIAVYDYKRNIYTAAIEFRF